MMTRAGGLVRGPDPAEAVIGRLNRLVGRPLGAPIAAADSLVVPPGPPDLDRLVAAALAARPELADLKSQLEGARAVTGLAREYWLPDFTIGVTRGSSPTNFS